MAAKNLSVIIPTYNEVDNIKPLCTRLFASTKRAGIEAELLVMDDESAGSVQTEAIVKELAKDFPIRIHRRYKHEGRGLSSAVLLGFDQARYDVLLCMDADLQHEPESVPAVAMPVIDGTSEMTIGSRHVGGGGLGFDWSVSRRIISAVATLLALGITSSSDPMSGFFCVRKSVYRQARARYNPIGFKIGLEIMSRARCKVMDVPITFQERLHGESKLTMKQNVEYVQHLINLYWDRHRIVIVVVLAILAGLLAVAVTLAI